MLPTVIIVTPAVYPHLVVNYDFSKFFYKKDPLNLESQNQAQNIPVGLPSSQIKIWFKFQDIISSDILS